MVLARGRGCLFLSLLLSSVFIWAKSAQAHEAVFGYSYTANTLAKGAWEVEQWYSGAFGKSHGSYANSLFRTEVEYGITDRLQGAIYLNSRHVYANHNNLDGTTGGEGVPDTHNSNERYNKYKFETVSFEAIYQVLNPHKDPFGFALYVEPQIGPDQYGIEPKLIFQKNFLEDQLIFVVNNIWEMEWEHETKVEAGEPEKDILSREMEFENTLGLTYRLNSKIAAGIEFKNQNKFSSFRLKDIEHNAYFLGPTVHYDKKGFEVTATILAQLPFARGYTDEQKAAIVDGKIFGHEHEAAEFRLKLGWEF